MHMYTKTPYRSNLSFVTTKPLEYARKFVEVLVLNMLFSELIDVCKNPDFVREFDRQKLSDNQ